MTLHFTSLSKYSLHCTTRYALTLYFYFFPRRSTLCITLVHVPRFRRCHTTFLGHVVLCFRLVLFITLLRHSPSFTWLLRECFSLAHPDPEPACLPPRCLSCCFMSLFPWFLLLPTCFLLALPLLPLEQDFLLQLIAVLSVLVMQE